MSGRIAVGVIRKAHGVSGEASVESWTDAPERFDELEAVTLVDAEGRERGVVIDVYEGGGGILLNVKRPDGREFELPFAADICKEIDLPARRIVVAIPEGLEDLEAIQE